MRRIVASLIITSALLQAQELNSEKFQLVAKNIDAKDKVITAIGDVVIYSPTYYLSADKVIFDQTNETFELFDNVLIIKDNSIQTQSNYAFVDIKNDISRQNPTFLYDTSSNIWINTEKSNKNKEIVDLESAIISSCDCEDPVWSIKASSMDYDTENMWINTYNSRLYVKDMPVFYFPYFGFPTDTTRRTGLLIPTIGYSSSQGFRYSQPIFFALADDYDLELIPDIRTSRGKGVYATFRYADSPDSMLKINAGYFNEMSKYMKEETLTNKEDYGADLEYSRRNIFATNKEHEDGVYVLAKYLNGVEYHNLSPDAYSLNSEYSNDRKVESKFNYYYNTPNYYAGAYARYYIDTTRDSETKDMISNNETVQEVPQIHLHSYNKELLDSLVYSMDAKYVNYARPRGLNADVYEFSLPISYNKYLIEDYLYLALENKTTINQYNYSNYKEGFRYRNGHNSFEYEDGTLIQNTTSIGVGSDLIKPYEDYLHTVNLNATYVIPKNIKEDGDLYGITVEKEDRARYTELGIFPSLKDQKYINLSINQSLYEKETLKQFINHKMTQSILYDEIGDARFEDFENYLKINHKYGSISGRVIYNIEDGQVVEDSIDNTFIFGYFTLGAGYYKSKATENIFNDRADLESYRLSASYKLAKDYSIRYYENYNIKDKTRNIQGIGLNINDSCWNLDLLVEKEIEPRSTGDYDSQEQTILYAILTLKPLGGIRQNYTLSESDK